MEYNIGYIFGAGSMVVIEAAQNASPGNTLAWLVPLIIWCCIGVGIKSLFKKHWKS